METVISFILFPLSFCSYVVIDVGLALLDYYVLDFFYAAAGYLVFS